MREAMSVGRTEGKLIGPRHVAIIMDGNGRWALGRRMSRHQGHEYGVQALMNLLRGVLKRSEDCQNDIRYLTLYSFSLENWGRPSDEIGHFMQLLRFYLRKNLDELNRNNVRLCMIGNRKRLPQDVVTMIDNAEKTTAGNDALTLVIALSYGARDEIVRAARYLAQEVKNGEIEPHAIDEQRFASKLSTSAFPDPDLVIRTGGEKRMSNFLLWQSAYSELVFVDKFWPDFTVEDFNDALLEFRRRIRRYGVLID